MVVEGLYLLFFLFALPLIELDLLLPLISSESVRLDQLVHYLHRTVSWLLHIYSLLLHIAAVLIGFQVQ